MNNDNDIVIVGGGIAGASMGLALARAGLQVVILEFQDEYHDLVRGEMLSPWGAGEADRLGVGDALYAAAPEPLLRWAQWDEVYHPDEAPVIDLTMYAVGAPSPLGIHHYKTCQSMATAARAAGATLLMGVRDLEIEAGLPPTIRFAHDGAQHSLTPKLVIGAGGRNGPTGKQVGKKLEYYSHHWGGGLAVEGLDEWPRGLQAMGTEGNRMFFVFPQQHGRARLYLNYATEDARLYAGPDGTARFLEAFDLKCMPLSELVLQAKPIGPCMNAPSKMTWIDHPYAPGVVLVGDEAGANDPVLGTGLSNAFRDARIVFELIMESSTWTPETFFPYEAERTDRLRKLNFAADLMGKLSAEFGPDAAERRSRAYARMRKNPNYMVTMAICMSGPDRVPDFAFSDYLAERLLADEGTGTVRTPRLTDVSTETSVPASVPA